MLCLVRSIRWIVFYQDGAPSMGVLSRKNIHSTTSLNFSALLAVSRIIRYVVISIGVSVRRYWIQIPSSAKRIFPFRITFKYSQFSSNESCEKCFSIEILLQWKLAQIWAKTQNKNEVLLGANLFRAERDEIWQGLAVDEGIDTEAKNDASHQL